jgi:hypothetical protein
MNTGSSEFMTSAEDATPTPLHHCQSSLEAIINFSLQPPLEPHQRERAKRRFYSIIENFKTAGDRVNEGYQRPLLIQYIYEYSLSDQSKDTFLRAVFDDIQVTLDDDEDINFSDTTFEEGIRSALTKFADYLIYHFFLPRKA